MMNHDEMYQSVLSKYKEYQEKKQKRIRMVKRTAPVLACLCLTMAFGIGYWGHLKNLPNISVQPDIIEESTIGTPDVTTAVTGNNIAIRTDDHTKPASTTESTSKSKTDRPTTTTGKQTNTLTTFVADVSETQVSTQITSKQTESQAHVTTTVTQLSTEVQITEPPTTTKVIPIQEIKIGYYNPNYSKPLPSARIALKCNEFSYPGEKLMIDVAKGDGAYRQQDYDSNRVYEYSVSPTENNAPITDDNLIVNGEIGGYKKEYAGEEMQIFDINGKYDDYDAYQHEITEIDFNNYPIGSSGCITFSFKAIFTDDPTNTSTSGMMQNIYFYVGEIGVVVSPFGIEEAMEEYQNISSLF